MKGGELGLISSKDPGGSGLQTWESRGIGGAISHAEDGRYCPSRHGESMPAISLS